MEYIYISRDENSDHLKQTNVEEHQDRFEWVGEYSQNVLLNHQQKQMGIHVQ